MDVRPIREPVSSARRFHGEPYGTTRELAGDGFESRRDRLASSPGDGQQVIVVTPKLGSEFQFAAVRVIMGQIETVVRQQVGQLRFSKAEASQQAVDLQQPDGRMLSDPFSRDTSTIAGDDHRTAV